MRICSLLPSATEILYALGLGESVAAVTFECDYPEEVRRKPVVVHSAMTPGLSPGEIDREVKEFAARGDSLYRLDRELLERLRPDLVVTQELCDVCAVTSSHLTKTLFSLPLRPEILSLTPHTLRDVLADLERVGDAAGVSQAAAELVQSLEARMEMIRAKVNRAKPKRVRPRVACLEWLEPLFKAGHWVPEMVEMAGGVDAMGVPGEKSVGMHWEELRAAQPDVIVVMPCGYDAAAAAEEFRRLSLPKWWGELPAVQEGRVYAVNATAYFSRPGPRLVDGIELLYQLLQKESPEGVAPDSYLRLEAKN